MTKKRSALMLILMGLGLNWLSRALEPVARSNDLVNLSTAFLMLVSLFLLLIGLIRGAFALFSSTKPKPHS